MVFHNSLSRAALSSFSLFSKTTPPLRQARPASGFLALPISHAFNIPSEGYIFETLLPH